MPIIIKKDGSWVNANPYVKDNGQWYQAKQGWAKVDGTWTLMYTSAALDDFNRINNTNIGTIPETDYVWTKTNGDWSISNQQVTSSTAPSSYPLLTINYGNPDAVLSVKLNDQGSSAANSYYGGGVAFWASDANNWWAAHSNAVQTTNYVCPSTIQLTSKTATYSSGSIDTSGSGTCTYIYGTTTTTTTSPTFTFGCQSGTGPRTLNVFQRDNLCGSSTSCAAAIWKSVQSSTNQCILGPSISQTSGAATTCTSWRVGNAITSTYIYSSPISSGGHDCYNIDYSNGTTQTGTSTASVNNGPARPIYGSTGGGGTVPAANYQTGTQTVTTHTCDDGGTKVADNTTNGCRFFVTSSSSYVQINFTYSHSVRLVQRSGGGTPQLIQTYNATEVVRYISVTSNGTNVQISYSQNPDGSGALVGTHTVSEAVARGSRHGLIIMPSSYQPGTVFMDDFTIATP